MTALRTFASPAAETIYDAVAAADTPEQLDNITRTLWLGYGEGKTHHMNMDHSAWEGFEIDGHVDTVLSRGKVVVDSNEYLGAKGDGKFVKRGLSQYLI